MVRLGEFVSPDSKTYWARKTTIVIWYWKKKIEKYITGTQLRIQRFYLCQNVYDQSGT